MLKLKHAPAFEIPLFSWISAKDHLSLPPDVVLNLEEKIASGLWNHAVASEKGAVQHFLILCSSGAALVSGQTRHLLILNEDLQVSDRFEDKISEELWCERRFLAGLAFYRLGFTQSASEIWTDLRRRIPFLENRSVLQKITIEEASQDMNRCIPERAISRIADAFEGPLSDVYYVARAYGILANCYKFLGDFPSAHQALLKEKSVLERTASPQLQLANRCRLVAVKVEEEKAVEAQREIDKAIELTHLSPNSHALLLKYQVRVSLLEGKAFEATSWLSKLDELLEKHSISKRFINDIQERVESLLQQKEFVKAIEIVRSELWDAISKNDAGLECSLRLFLARVQMEHGALQEALQTTLAAKNIAIEKALNILLVRANFISSVLHFKNGERQMAHSALSLAKHAAFKFRLSVHQIALSYWHAWLRHQSSSFALVHVAKHPRDLSSAVALLQVTGAWTDETFVLKETGLPDQTLSAEELCRRISESSSVFWFASEGLLYFSGAELVFSQNEATHKFIKKLLSSRKAMSTAEIHSLDSKVSFVEYKHGAKVRSLIQRVNKLLAPLGIRLSHEKEKGGYALHAETGILRVDSSSVTLSQASLNKVNAKKADLIFEAIKKRGGMSTHDLCKMFDMRRQSLHPYLKHLEEKGLLRMMRLGPHTCYLPQNLEE